jgi:hypothetical protein
MGRTGRGCVPGSDRSNVSVVERATRCGLGYSPARPTCCRARCQIPATGFVAISGRRQVWWGERALQRLAATARGFLRARRFSQAASVRGFRVHGRDGTESFIESVRMAGGGGAGFGDGPAAAASVDDPARRGGLDRARDGHPRWRGLRPARGGGRAARRRPRSGRAWVPDGDAADPTRGHPVRAGDVDRTL